MVSSKVEAAQDLQPDTSTLPTKDHRPNDPDRALDFIINASATEADVRGIDPRRVRAKADRRLVPIMLASYTLFFIDKILLNYASIMGMNTDLHLVSNDFSNAAASVAIAHLCSQPIHGFVLNKVSAAKYMVVNIFLWGITTAATAGTRDYATLVATRVFLGLFEGAIAPCIALLLSQWYTKDEQATRFGGFFLGLGLGQIFGGLLSFAFQHVTGASLAGWRILFLVCGLLTIVDGVAVYVLIPDTPMVAKFLSEAEKLAVLAHVEENKTGVSNTHFKPRQIWEMVKDVQIWLLAITLFLGSIPSGVISSYSSTLIRGFGYNAKQAALLNLPSGVISIVATLVAAYGSRHTGVRGPWLLLCFAFGLLGGGLMSFLPKSNRAGLLTGIYLVNSVVPVLPLVFQWTAANVAGHTKRPFSQAVMAGAYGAGAIVGPQTFQAKDAPAYTPARITVMAVMAGGAFCTVLLCAYYHFDNRSKDRKFGQPEQKDLRDEKAWDNVTDRDHLDFRYVY